MLSVSSEQNESFISQFKVLSAAHKCFVMSVV